MENKRNIIFQEYNCPRCGALMDEKRPKDKRVVRNKEVTVRMSCFCGYYFDQVVKVEDFIDGKD